MKAQRTPRHGRTRGASAGGRVLLTAVAVTLLTSGLPGRANATYVAETTGQVQEVRKYTVIAAGSLLPGAFTSVDRIRVFEEQVNIELGDVITVDISPPTAPSPGKVDVGTQVTSYLLHADTGGAGGVTALAGTVRFSDDILGIATSDANLDGSDDDLKLDGVDYPTGVLHRGLESGAAADVVTLVDNRTISVDLQLLNGIDQIRVVINGHGRGVTFSIDFQGPTPGQLAAFPEDSVILESDLLTVGDGGPPGPNVAVPAPVERPGIMRNRFDLGILYTARGFYELDALSFGRDWGWRVRFSVDEWADGIPTPVPGVYSEASAPGGAEAAADVFNYRGPGGLTPWPPPMFGNSAFLDGDGSSLRGLGLVEPNPPAPGLPDEGDNLDALSMGTTWADIEGPIYFSLDAMTLDPHEMHLFVNSGTADANGFSGADVLVLEPGATTPRVYAHYYELGLDDNEQEGTIDDIDALAVWDNGDMIYDEDVDRILFSVRRASSTTTRDDSRTGRLIAEGDILMKPANPGQPPAIAIHAEALGLLTRRTHGVSDDLDALHVYVPTGAPIAEDDQATVAPDGTTIIFVPVNDFDPDGQLLPESVVIVEPPEAGVIGQIGPMGGVPYTHNGGPGTLDRFTYIVYDDEGQASEPATVTVHIDGAVGVSSPGSLPDGARLRILGANPSASLTLLSFMTGRAGDARLEVFDPAGRLVRRLVADTFQAGEARTVAWDGRDRHGREVGAGVYLVRLVIPEGTQELSVVRLR